MNISVNLIGANGVKTALRQYAARVESETASMNARTAVEVLTDVRRTLQQETPYGQFGGDTGTIAGRYHVEVLKGGQKVYVGGDGRASQEYLSAPHTDDKSALVGAVSDHVLPVEFGRAPGSKPPPSSALRDWLRRHGLDESLAYPVARAIGRRGIQALPHLHPAIERARSRHVANLTNGIKKAGEEAAK